MFKIPKKHPWPPELDTTTVRAELARIGRDLELVPDLRPAALIIADAIEELKNADARSRLGENLIRDAIRRARKPGDGSI